MDVLNDTDPRTVDPKDLDPRISYDTVEDKWIFEDPNSTADGFEYNVALKRWIPLELTSESNMTDAQKEILAKRRQKVQEMKDSKDSTKEKRNTAVYVSGLPLDCDALELKQVFSKYGVVAEDLLTGKPKIKMYVDDTGSFKGDALVVYMKPESVDLAVQMLDDSKLRANGESIKVQPAQFKEKAPSVSTKESTVSKRQLSEDDKKLIKKKLKKMTDKVEDWHGDDEHINPKWLRTMILRRVFTFEEIKNPNEKAEIVEDIRDGCEEFGIVERVIVFDQEEDGVVMVRFEGVEAANACIEKMDGRFFGGRKLMATRYNGEEFRKSEEAPKRDEMAASSTDYDEDGDHDRLNTYIEQVGDS